MLIFCYDNSCSIIFASLFKEASSKDFLYVFYSNCITSTTPKYTEIKAVPNMASNSYGYVTHTSEIMQLSPTVDERHENVSAVSRKFVIYSILPISICVYHDGS
jgi:hypothetical protein